MTPRQAGALTGDPDALRAFKDIATLRHVDLERPPDAPTTAPAAAAAARERGMNRLAERLGRWAAERGGRRAPANAACRPTIRRDRCRPHVRHLRLRASLAGRRRSRSCSRARRGARPPTRLVRVTLAQGWEFAPIRRTRA